MRLAPRGPSNTLSLIGYGNHKCSPIRSLIELLDLPWAEWISASSTVSQTTLVTKKGQQHPKDFPGGHPPQYYPGLARLNFGVRSMAADESIAF